MADINNLDNWSGPHVSRANALEDIQTKCGGGYEALLWFRRAKWYINDGIDPDTGKPWATMPKGGVASWVKIW